MSDYNLTLFEACELLNRSKKSISRYIRRGLLHPQEIKSQQGTLEYRFSKADLEAFKLQETQDKTRQETGDTPDETRQSGQTRQDIFKNNNIKNKEVLEETRQDKTQETGHDKPIKEAETLENKDFKGQTEQTGHDAPDKTRQDSEVITLLKETTGLLKDQLKVKDEQIKDLGGKIDQLIERDRETNILLKGLQDKVLMLEKPQQTDETGQPDETGQDLAGETGQDEPIKRGFIEKVKDYFTETK
jgi:hypothetical protein